MPFNLENALNILNKTNRNFKDKAIKRLEYYASHICMKCTVPLVSEGEEMEIPKTNDEYFKLKIIFNETGRESNKEQAKVEHLICSKCVDKILKQESVDKQKEKNCGTKVLMTPSSKKIDCKICEEDHNIDLKDWNNILKKSCCQGCIIY
jgi:hypothetical protein